MSKDYRVNTFGLTDEENTLVEESLPTRAYAAFPDLRFVRGDDAINKHPPGDGDTLRSEIDQAEDQNGG